MKRKGKGKVLCWFQFGSQDLNWSERLGLEKDLRLSPSEVRKEKGMWLGAKERMQEINLYFRSVFFFPQMVRSTFLWVSGEDNFPGTEVHDTFWAKVACDLYEMKLSYLVFFHRKCPWPLEGSVPAVWGGTGPVGDLCPSGVAVEACTASQGHLRWHQLPYLANRINPIKNAHLVAKLELCMCNLWLFQEPLIPMHTPEINISWEKNILLFPFKLPYFDICTPSI